MLATILLAVLAALLLAVQDPALLMVGDEGVGELGQRSCESAHLQGQEGGVRERGCQRR